MATRPNRATQRAHKRAAWSRRNQERDLTIGQAMRPAVGGRSKVSYAGSGDSGYASDWSKPGSVGGKEKPVIIDARWSGHDARLTQQETEPRVHYRPARRIG